MNCGQLAAENETCSRCGAYQEEPEAAAERIAAQTIPGQTDDTKTDFFWEIGIIDVDTD